MRLTQIYEYPVEKIPLNKIIKSKFNYRDIEENLDELAKSIAQNGLLVPVIVRPLENYYELISGNRRVEACKKLGWKYIPAIIVEMNDKEAFIASLVENIQRETLDPIQEAKAYNDFVHKYGWGSVTELAKLIGKSEPYVSHRIMLLNLPKEVQDLISTRQLKPSTARELVWINDPRKQKEIAEKAVKEKLSVRDVRQIVNESKKEKEIDFHLLIYRKIELMFRSTLINLDGIIEKVQDDPELKKNLFELRYSLHMLIDKVVHYKKERRKFLDNSYF
jgi:ParB family chromosome partitioning protein